MLPSWNSWHPGMMDTADPELSDSSVNAVNPFELPEVIEKIVIHLKPKELFKCRLVNKSWKKEADKELGKKFIFPMSRTTRDATFQIHAINDKGFYNYLQLNLKHLNLQGKPQLIPPLIQNLAITKFAILTTNLFTSVGPFLRKIILNVCETHTFRSLDLILTNCQNLEYLDFTTWGDFQNNMLTTIQNYQQVDKFRNEPAAIANIQLLKLKTLILKFTRYHPTMDNLYYQFIANILNKVPNLQVLELPYFEPGRRVIIPPGITRALLEFMPTLTKLQKLNIGYRFNNNNNNNNNNAQPQPGNNSNELFQLLSCTKFQLTDLKLNENLLTILPITIYYQRKLNILTASLRYFNWAAFQRWLITRRLPTMHQQNGTLRIQLIDFYNLERCNIMDVLLYKRQQVLQVQPELAAAGPGNGNGPIISGAGNGPIIDAVGNGPLIAAGPADNFGVGNIGGVLAAFKSCQSTTFNFFQNFNTLLQRDPNMVNTISTLNLGNIGSLEVRDIIYLGQLHSLRCFQLKPSSDNVLRYIFITMPRLIQLSIMLGADFQQPSYVFESAICGQSVKDCYQQFIKYSAKPTMGYYCTVEEMFPVIPTAFPPPVEGGAPYTMSNVCICRLQNLRRLDIKNCGVPGHFKYLSELSIMTCFHKLPLIHLKMPYKGSKNAILYLQAKNPALDLELED